MICSIAFPDEYITNTGFPQSKKQYERKNVRIAFLFTKSLAQYSFFPYLDKTQACRRDMQFRQTGFFSKMHKSSSLPQKTQPISYLRTNTVLPSEEISSGVSSSQCSSFRIPAGTTIRPSLSALRIEPSVFISASPFVCGIKKVCPVRDTPKNASLNVATHCSGFINRQEEGVRFLTYALLTIIKPKYFNV